MTVDEMLAREAIRGIMAVYNNAGDRGASEDFASAFTEDGWLEVWGVRHEGRAGIKAFAENVAGERRVPATPAAGKPFVRHHTTTSRLEIASPTEARGWTYFIIHSNAGFTDTGVYVDTFRKVGPRWLIATRRVKLDGKS